MPSAIRNEEGGRRAHISSWNDVVYDFLLWIFNIVTDIFFREVHPRGSWKIPRQGPVIFVAAPHANQFVDPLILMRIVRAEARRRISFLIAEKSTRRRFVGMAARATGTVSVGRALDMTKAAPGRVYLPDPKSDPCLIRGVDTNFKTSQFQVGGLLVLPSVNGTAPNAEILEILSAEELRLKKPFKADVAMRQLTGKDEDGASTTGGSDYQGTTFKVAPKVDQTHVYNEVFAKLRSGGCIGIFPEGGSHDRTELLPLKAGVAIMALGSMAMNPDAGLKVIPCGMNYFHPHKFRSRAVVEFGTPVEIPRELVELYKSGERREAVGQVLKMIYDSLLTVTVTSPDYDTLMLIQAVRRLYNPKHKKLPLPMVVELNRRLVQGYKKYKEDPRIVSLKGAVLKYNRDLVALGIRDHQVEYARLSVIKVIFTLFYRIAKFITLSLAVLPGLLLFSPIFIAGKLISIKKSKEALAASTVKIHARDVVATWKILVSMALAPTIYTVYVVVLYTWTRYNRVGGRVPDSVPAWTVFPLGYIVFGAITFASLRFGEVSMDILKSLKPLVLCLNPSSSNTLVQLRQRREELTMDLTELINTLGPEMFPDFNSHRIIADPFADESSGRRHARNTSESSTPSAAGGEGAHLTRLSTADEPITPTTPSGESGNGDLPRNDSLKNLADIGIFATRPATPSHPQTRSRSGSSGGFPLHGFSTLTSGGLEEVKSKIRGAMKERGARRASVSGDSSDTGEGSWEAVGAESGAATPVEMQHEGRKNK